MALTWCSFSPTLFYVVSEWPLHCLSIYVFRFHQIWDKHYFGLKDWSRSCRGGECSFHRISYYVVRYRLSDTNLRRPPSTRLIVSIISAAGLNLCVVASLQKPPYLKQPSVRHQLVLLMLGFRCLSLHHVLGCKLCRLEQRLQFKQSAHHHSRPLFIKAAL